VAFYTSIKMTSGTSVAGDGYKKPSDTEAKAGWLSVMPIVLKRNAIATAHVIGHCAGIQAPAPIPYGKVLNTEIPSC
jgi:hypothetical protein